MHILPMLISIEFVVPAERLADRQAEKMSSPDRRADRTCGDVKSLK